MKQILLIGIGAGDPDYVTIQAVKALNRVDVFFVLDKGEVKQDLVDVRQEILDRHVDRAYRVWRRATPSATGRRPRTPRPCTTGAAAGRTCARS